MTAVSNRSAPAGDARPLRADEPRADGSRCGEPRSGGARLEQPRSGQRAVAHFRTDDVAAADDFLRRTYWDYEARPLGTVEAFRFHHAARSDGPCAMVELEHNAAYEHVTEASGEPMLVSVRRGRVERTTRAGTEWFTAGDVFLLAQPGEGYSLRWDELQAVAMPVRLPDAASAEATSADGTSVDPAGQVVRFGRLATHCPGQRAMLRRTFGFIDKVVLAPDSAQSSDLVLGSAARLVQALVTDVFGAPGDGSKTREQSAGDQGTFRRARDYIEANADRDITLADIAAAAFASPRSVQLSFRRYLDTTPMAHLRLVRLERVHEELRASSPADGTTVTQVAAHWGFASMGRFAQDYRAVYGLRPSETLGEE